jgi:hypothetical protein
MHGNHNILSEDIMKIDKGVSSFLLKVRDRQHRNSVAIRYEGNLLKIQESLRTPLQTTLPDPSPTPLPDPSPTQSPIPLEEKLLNTRTLINTYGEFYELLKSNREILFTKNIIYKTSSMNTSYEER